MGFGLIITPVANLIENGAGVVYGFPRWYIELIESFRPNGKDTQS